MSRPWSRSLPALGLLLAVATLAPTPAVAADPAAPGLDEPAQGRAALRAFEGALPSEVREVLRSDETSWLDTDGRLFFTDAVPEVSAAPVAPAAAAYPLDQTFQLHSKAGSQRTIYLDFDGHTVSGTFWNSDSGVSTAAQPAWDLDGSPATFGDRERTAIQDIWARVAEDYAPFDVDVTTQDPGEAALTRAGSGDQVYGTRALVTPSSQAQAAICTGGCGGVAYVDVFDNPSQHARLQPAWIFPQQLGNDTKNIAEAVAHEVGHNLGLKHDGTSSSAYYSGHGFWAPIMGSGYNAALVQWSQGSYAGATNTQDDVAVITASGVAYRTDEAGSTVATAARLPSGPAYVSTRTDLDVYALGTCSGTVTVAGLNAASSPDLDLRLRLLNASGAEVAAAGPTSAVGYPARDTTLGTDATVSATGLLPGAYYVEVDGVGNGSWATQYDDYGSLGAYTLAASGGCEGSLPAATVPSAPVAAQAGWDAASAGVRALWEPPVSDGGAPVERYEASVDGGAVRAVAPDQRTVLVTGAAPGQPVAITVAACNAIGCGPAAAVGASVPGGSDPATAPSGVTTPGAPRVAKAFSGAKGRRLTAGVRWRAPASTGGGLITEYLVIARPVGRGPAVRRTSTKLSPSATVAELRLPRGRYRFVVRAATAAGHGPWSAPSKVVRAR